MMIKYKTDLCMSFCCVFDTMFGGFDLNKYGVQYLIVRAGLRGGQQDDSLGPTE